MSNMTTDFFLYFFHRKHSPIETEAIHRFENNMERDVSTGVDMFRNTSLDGIIFVKEACLQFLSR